MKNNMRQVKELVRSDINLERWPEIFATRFYPYKSREIVRYEDGKKKQVIIGRMPDGTEVGVLDAQDGKVFYTLLKWWEEAGKPDHGYVQFTIRRLIEKIRGKKGKLGSEDYENVTKRIKRLTQIPIQWTECYERENEEISIGFNLIDSYRIFVRNRDKPGKYFGFSEVKINDEIVKTLKLKSIKPLRLDVIRELKSDIAFILYRWLDITLYAIPVGGTYSRDLKEVAKICGIEKQPMYKIKQQIQKAIKELEGKEITSGTLKNIRVEESKTPSGWKLMVEKGSLPKPEVIAVVEHPELPETQLTGTELAKELVLYFHEQLGHQEVKPTSLEISQAAKLINEHGLEWSKELVEYVIDWLRERGMTVHVFGYVLTLENEFQERKDEIRREEEKRKREKEEKQYRKSQLSKLPEMIYQRLYEEIKSRLLLKYKDDTYILASLEGRTYPDAGQKVVEEEMIKVIKTFPVVTLKYVDSKAQDVKYAGDWTNWQPKPMDQGENGMWFKEIRLPAGVYKYKFIVDGIWIPDPAGEQANDGFGNSVLNLK